MSIAALDIGGANLKAAHDAGTVRFVPFEVWRNPQHLPSTVEEVLRDLPPTELIAVTMTAELCDCYATKREGVLRVLEAVEAAAAAAAPGAVIKVFRLDGKLADLEAARSEPLACASANWMALATFGAPLLGKRRGVVADTGSTTTDIVPVRGGMPTPGGKTDSERLLLGELVYTGVRRTPVFAVSDQLPYHLRSCPVAAETFATMLDAYLLTGDVAEEPPGPDGVRCGTADGRPATRACAQERLARMVCADRETFDRDDAVAAARYLAAAQEKKVRQALLQVAEHLGGPLEAAVVAGEGEFILRRAIHRIWPRCEIVSMAERFGAEAARSACAFALLSLAARSAQKAGSAS